MTRCIFLWHPFQGKPFRELGDIVNDDFEIVETNVTLPDAIKRFSLVYVYYGRYDTFFERDNQGTIVMKPRMSFLKGDFYKDGRYMGNLFFDMKLRT